MNFQSSNTMVVLHSKRPTGLAETAKNWTPMFLKKQHLKFALFFEDHTSFLYDSQKTKLENLMIFQYH